MTRIKKFTSKILTAILISVLFINSGCSLLGLEDDENEDTLTLLIALFLLQNNNEPVSCSTTQGEGIQGCGGLNLTGIVTTLAGSGTNGY